MDRPLLELVEVSKVYLTGDTEVRALDRISLTVEAGEFVAIIGQSGSGKSTLMNILGCLDQPGSGTYRVAGQDVADLDRDELATLRRDHFGFVFQRYNLLATATAAENVEMPAVYAGRSRSERSEAAERLLARLGLADRAEHRPNQLSGGQQQRVSIARALVNGAEVILADEPTGALDSRSGQEVLALLAELNAEGRTVLLITHDPAVAAHARRVIRLADGRIVEDTGAPASEAVAPVEPRTQRGGGGVPDLAETLKMAFRSLRVNLFRTSLTLLGIVIGVAAVVAMLAIGDGTRQRVVQNIQAMGTDLLVVRPGAPGSRPTAELASLVDEDATAIAELPNVITAAPERNARITLRSGGIDYMTTVQGTWPGFVEARNWSLADGSSFTDEDVQGYAPVVVLGQTAARNLFPGESPVGQFVLLRNVPFEVIGVLGPKGATAFGQDQDDIAVVPLSTGYIRLFGQRFLNSISVKVADESRIDDTQEAITSLLIERHKAEDFQIRNMASVLETAQETAGTLTLLLGSVAAISLLVGGIGVMNIMLVSVVERTREIGIRMATGARMRDILLQFNSEALVVCTLGGLVGVGLGLGAALLAGNLGLPIAITAEPALMATACAVLTGLIFGFLPARKAARLDPVVALAAE